MSFPTYIKIQRGCRDSLAHGRFNDGNIDIMASRKKEKGMILVSNTDPDIILKPLHTIICYFFILFDVLSSI